MGKRIAKFDRAMPEPKGPPLTPEQWDMVLSVIPAIHKSTWKWTPISLREDDAAMAFTYDVLLDFAIYCSRAWRPTGGRNFCSYFVEYAQYRVRQRWLDEYMRPTSLDVPNEEGKTLGPELVSHRHSPANPTSEWHPAVDLVKSLSPNQRFVVENRLGLRRHWVLSELEMSICLGVTRQRINQLYHHGIQSMREKCCRHRVGYEGKFNTRSGN